MPTLKLKTETVTALPFVVTGQTLYWDTELKGFGLRVSTKRKTYFVEAKVRGATIRRTLKHPHPQITAIQARREALSLLASLRDGIDPREQQKAHTASQVTLREAAEAYLGKRQLKPVTIRDYRIALDKHLADWSSLPLTKITKDMVSAKHATLGIRSKAQANLAMRFLRAVFNFAIEHYDPHVQSNPVRRLSAAKAWYRIDRRHGYIAPHQMKAWFDAVESLKNHRADENRETFRDYLLLLLFTGFRRTEAATLAWDNVNFAARTFTVIDPKNGYDHTLPMSDFLYRLLDRRRQGAVGPYVFSGHNEEQPIREPRKTILRVCGDSGVTFRAHDLRRTFTGIADSLDLSSYAIKRLLNHKTKDVTEGYIPLNVERLRDPMQRIANLILKQAERLPSGAILAFRPLSERGVQYN